MTEQQRMVRVGTDPDTASEDYADDDLEHQRQQPWHPASRGWVG